MLSTAGFVRSLLTAAVAGPVLLAGPALAGDDGGYRLEVESTTVTVRDDRSSWGDERQTATVRLRARCDDDRQPFGWVRLTLTQRNVTATDGAMIYCGDEEHVTIDVSGASRSGHPWRPGPAVVEAAMYRPDGSEIVDRESVRLQVAR